MTAEGPATAGPERRAGGDRDRLWWTWQLYALIPVALICLITMALAVSYGVFVAAWDCSAIQHWWFCGGAAHADPVPFVIAGAFWTAAWLLPHRRIWRWARVPILTGAVLMFCFGWIGFVFS